MNLKNLNILIIILCFLGGWLYGQIRYKKGFDAGVLVMYELAFDTIKRSNMNDDCDDTLNGDLYIKQTGTTNTSWEGVEDWLQRTIEE